MVIVIEIAFMFGLVGVDLFSKWAIDRLLIDFYNSYAVIGGILEFRYVPNYGASFGVFDGQKTLLIVITILTVILLLAVLYIKPKTPKLFRYSLLTIVGGAIGNIVDRCFLGYVRDFIDYKFLDTWFGIDFAIGNIADIFCLLGVLMLIVYVVFCYKDGDLNFFRKKTKVALIEGD